MTPNFYGNGMMPRSLKEVKISDWLVNEKRIMTLSDKTIEGLQVTGTPCLGECLYNHSLTVKPFVEMSNFLLTQPGSDGLFILSVHISHILLENISVNSVHERGDETTQLFMTLLRMQ